MILWHITKPMHRLLPVACYQKVRSYSDYIDQDDQQKKGPLPIDHQEGSHFIPETNPGFVLSSASPIYSREPDSTWNSTKRTIHSTILPGIWGWISGATRNHGITGKWLGMNNGMGKRCSLDLQSDKGGLSGGQEGAGLLSLQRILARLGQCSIREKQPESTGVDRGNALSPLHE